MQFDLGSVDPANVSASTVKTLKAVLKKNKQELPGPRARKADYVAAVEAMIAEDSQEDLASDQDDASHDGHGTSAGDEGSVDNDVASDVASDVAEDGAEVIDDKPQDDVQPQAGTSVSAVFLFVPNLIGYARVLLLGGSCYMFKQGDAYMSMMLYMASMMLDAFDGMAARALDQTSRVGCVLDMVTDRVTTMMLTVMLALLDKERALHYAALIALDFASHWVHMYASLTVGSSSHKTIDTEKNVLLRAYYSVPYLMFVTCVFAEAFYISLFMLHFHSEPTIAIAGEPWCVFAVTAALSTPLFVFKQIVNVIQMVEAYADLARLDVADRVKKVQ